MARLPYIDVDELADSDRDLLKRPINLFRQLVNSPGGARAFGTLGGYIRHKSTLDPRLREMAIIQVGIDPEPGWDSGYWQQWPAYSFRTVCRNAPCPF